MAFSFLFSVLFFFFLINSVELPGAVGCCGANRSHFRPVWAPEGAGVMDVSRMHGLIHHLPHGDGGSRGSWDSAILLTPAPTSRAGWDAQEA